MNGRRSLPTLARLSLALATAALFWVAAVPTAGAQDGWPHIALHEVADGFAAPVHVTHAGDGSGRLFVVEQQGIIRIVQDGQTLAAPFLDITDRALLGDEQGLLSVAFPPGYTQKAYFYVNYTRKGDGATVVARFGLTDDPNVADPASERTVLVVEQPYPNHNGGQIAFGPNDGYLYIGMGDGGDADDPHNNGQATDTLLGKMLRIDVETGNPLTYTVPADNPFVGVAGYRPEIWAVGLRNPWRFSFATPAGDLYMADVGQRTWEEVNFQPGDSAGGENYGWRILEGAHCFIPETGCVPPDDYVAPVAEYDHTLGCSVTGGHVYQGVYYFADYCTGRIWGLQREGGGWQDVELYDAPFSIATFGMDEAGRLYLADYDNGVIYRVLTGRAYLPLVRQ